MSLKYEFAFDENNELVHIDDAIPKKRYKFPGYKIQDVYLFPKNQGKIKRHHFALKNISNHEFIDNEGPLHRNTKYMIFLMLKNHRDSGRFYFLLKNCSCGENHKLNILKNVKDIYCDSKKLGNFLPDILIETLDGKTKVIEIVDKHDIEKETDAYYKNNKIIRFRIKTSIEYFEKLYLNFINKDNYINESETFRRNFVEKICKKAIEVTYYPEQKNIFPCMEILNSYSKYDELREYEQTKIDSKEKLHCLNCNYFKGFKKENLILCSSPNGKRELIQNKNTDIGFLVHFYFKSKKRSPTLYLTLLEFQDKLHSLIRNNSLDFFEYANGAIGDYYYNYEWDEDKKNWIPKDYDYYEEPIDHEKEVPLHLYMQKMAEFNNDRRKYYEWERKREFAIDKKRKTEKLDALKQELGLK